MAVVDQEELPFILITIRSRSMTQESKYSTHREVHLRQEFHKRLRDLALAAAASVEVNIIT